MSRFLIIGNGTTKNSLTLQEQSVSNYIHSSYGDEVTALRMAHWLNKMITGLTYYVEERIYGGAV